MAYLPRTNLVVTKMPRIRIIVADIFPVVRLGMKSTLEREPRFTVVAEADTVPSFRSKVILEQPDVGLIDWAMTLQESGPIIRLLRSRRSRTSIIFMVAAEDFEQQRLFEGPGHHAFLTKRCTARELRAAVWRIWKERVSRKAANAASVAAPGIHAGSAQNMELLSKRERQLLELIGRGLENKAIAQQLGVTAATARRLLGSVLSKLRVTDRDELAGLLHAQCLFVLNSGRKVSG